MTIADRSSKAGYRKFNTLPSHKAAIRSVDGAMYDDATLDGSRSNFERRRPNAYRILTRQSPLPSAIFVSTTTERGL